MYTIYIYTPVKKYAFLSAHCLLCFVYLFRYNNQLGLATAYSLSFAYFTR